MVWHWLNLSLLVPGVCDLDSKIYCIGGWNGQVGIKQCDVFDPATNTWTSIAPLQMGRYQAGVCSFGGLVYAVGGCDAWNCLNTVEVYDPKTDSWSYAKNIITARRGCGVAVFKGSKKVVVVMIMYSRSVPSQARFTLSGALMAPTLSHPLRYMMRRARSGHRVQT